LRFDHREVVAGDEAENVGGNRLSVDAEAQGERAVDGHVLRRQDSDDVSKPRDDRAGTHAAIVAGVGNDDDRPEVRAMRDRGGV